MSLEMLGATEIGRKRKMSKRDSKASVLGRMVEIGGRGAKSVIGYASEIGGEGAKVLGDVLGIVAIGLGLFVVYKIGSKIKI